MSGQRTTILNRMKMERSRNSLTVMVSHQTEKIRMARMKAPRIRMMPNKKMKGTDKGMSHSKRRKEASERRKKRRRKAQVN